MRENDNRCPRCWGKYKLDVGLPDLYLSDHGRKMEERLLTVNMYVPAGAHGNGRRSQKNRNPSGWSRQGIKVTDN